MSEFVSEHKGAVVYSIALHVAIAAAFSLNYQIPSWRRPAASPAPIQGMIVDPAVFEREQQRREEVVRQENQRRQREERERREAADAVKRAEEQRQRDQAAATKREQERVAEVERQRERAEQAEREKAEAAKREQDRVAQERREREAQAQREREAAEKKAQEESAAARARQQAENELQQQLAAEAQRNAAELDEYIRMITNVIERNWIAPPTARAGLDCMVHVVQIPSGDIMDVRIATCNGDEAVTRSIEAAVRRSSPLPKPRNPALFDRNLNVRFHPDL
jgi:colicin import membrane protein